ncbi:MAG: carboxypeptidase regulatory-like domain-containing protein [Gemmatimonadota bacterium]
MFNGRASISLMAVFLAGAITGCGGGGGGEEAPAEGGEQTAVEVANAGTINGTVDFTGTPPENAPIDMSEEPTCAEQHEGGARAETVVANNGKLENVFVYIKEGLSRSFPAPAENVVIDQVGCVYTPHVTGVMVGQGLVFKNSDGLAHNVKAQPSENRSFNISQPTSMSSSPQKFSSAEIMVPVQCDIHGWMQSYVGVVDHPYFAVSGDDGSFTLTNVPPGTYTVEAWHEKYGTQTQQVTVAPDGTATVTFNYSATMAGARVPLGKPIDPHQHGS